MEEFTLFIHSSEAIKSCCVGLRLVFSVTRLFVPILFIPLCILSQLSHKLAYWMLSRISFGGPEGLTMHITTPCGLAEESWRLIDLYIWSHIWRQQKPVQLAKREVTESSIRTQATPWSWSKWTHIMVYRLCARQLAFMGKEKKKISSGKCWLIAIIWKWGNGRPEQCHSFRGKSDRLWEQQPNYALRQLWQEEKHGPIVHVLSHSFCQTYGIIITNGYYFRLN